MHATSKSFKLTPLERTSYDRLHFSNDKKGVTCMLLTMLFSRWALIPEKLGGGSVTGLLKLLLYFRKKNYKVFTALFQTLQPSI